MKRRRSEAKPPPEGYVCRACNESGHWIYDCTKCVASEKKEVASKQEVAGGVDCKCGIRAKKKRVYSKTLGPQNQWVCATGECQFKKPCERTKPNTRYLQRSVKREAKKKVFVSGLPFKGNTAHILKEFFEENDIAQPKKVLPLFDAKQRFQGQAYCVFEDADDAASAVALSGKAIGKSKDRWIDIKPARLLMVRKNKGDDPLKEEDEEEEEEDEEDEEEGEDDDE